MKRPAAVLIIWSNLEDRCGPRQRLLDSTTVRPQNERTADGLTPAEFIAKWSRAELSERAASQEHFIDLCRMLGQPTPAEHDATGAEFTFEKGVETTGGGSGFADVWWRGKFGWEYKRKDKYASLEQAYAQLCRYREALENPPLLIVSDIARIEIHTNFTNYKPDVIDVRLDGVGHPGMERSSGQRISRARQFVE